MDCSRLHGDEYERVTNKVSRQRIFNKDIFEIIELLELFSSLQHLLKAAHINAETLLCLKRFIVNLFCLFF